MIGFDQIVYQVQENAGAIIVQVSVQMGTLRRPVDVFFVTSDGTALGKYVNA